MSVAMRRRGWLAAPVLACSLLATACGDDDSSDGPSAPDDGGADSSLAKPDGSVSTMDSSVDAAVPPADAAQGFAPTIVTAQISATGNDRFWGVTHDSAGNIYAVGQTATTLTGADNSSVVAKYSKDGKLDTAFGTNGYAIKNVIVGAGTVEAGRGVVVQSSGKIVIAGNVEHAVYAADAGVGPLANDADIYLTRFNSDGTLDTTFGNQGVVVVDVGTGVVTTPTLADGGVGNPTLSGADSMWSLSQASDGKLVIHTATIGQGASLDGGVRTDTDFALLRLSADGVLDTSFGDTGIVRTDFSNTSVSVRSATVLANGSIVGAGYSTNTLLGASSQNPVLYKVTVNGTVDTSFGVGSGVSTPGLWFNYARPDQKSCEAYGAAPQGDKFVTLGYGANSGNTFGSDLVWLRFNADGSQDKSFGTNGVTTQDLGGYGDNGRGLTTLSDNRVLGVGQGRAKPAVAPEKGKEGELPQDGLVSVLSADGAPDTTFGPNGLRGIDLGGINDALYGVDLSPDKANVAAVGWGARATSTDDEDGVVVIFPAP